MFVDVPLAKRVNHLIEWSGSGILLDMASAALSLLSVFTYMVCWLGLTAAAACAALGRSPVRMLSRHTVDKLALSFLIC